MLLLLSLGWAQDLPSAAPVPVEPTAKPAPYDGPESWSGYSWVVRSPFKEGDKDGPLRISRATIDVPEDVHAHVRLYHDGENPTFKLINPSGAASPIEPGDLDMTLQKGTWTIEARESKKSEGAWAARIGGVAPGDPPGEGATVCQMLNYLAAQTFVDMRDARGKKLDRHFHEGSPLPGLPGTARIHHTHEYWHDLKNNSTEEESNELYAAASEAIRPCVDGWVVTNAGWEVHSAQKSRVLQFTSQTEPNMRVSIEQRTYGEDWSTQVTFFRTNR